MEIYLLNQMYKLNIRFAFERRMWKQIPLWIHQKTSVIKNMFNEKNVIVHKNKLCFYILLLKFKNTTET